MFVVRRGSKSSLLNVLPGLWLWVLSACGAPAGSEGEAAVERTEPEAAVASTSSALTLAIDETFVWAGASGGTPDPRWSYNSENGALNVVRLGTGQYRVELGRLYSTAGSAIVSAYGNSSHRCKIESWAPASASGGVNAYVRCHAASGALVDGSFLLSYVGGSAPGPYAHLWAQYADRDHTAPAQYSKNSAAQTNFIDWTATGEYTVTLNGLNASAGNVHVSAYGTDTNFCNVYYWSQVADDTVVRLRCYDSSGALANSRFTLRYVTTGMGYPGRSDLAYAWANNAITTSTYTPHTTYQFNSLPGEPAITARRTAAGKYALTIPGMPLIGTTALVTAYGGANHCHAKGWSGAETSAAGDGASSTLEVNCYNAQGSPADSQFTAAYVHAHPTTGAVCGWGASDCNRCVEGVESLFASANTSSSSHQHGRLGSSPFFDFRTFFLKHNEGIGRLNHPDGRYIVLTRAMDSASGQILMFRLSGYPSTQGPLGSSASHSTANTVVWQFNDEPALNHPDGLSVMGNYFIHGISCEDDACEGTSNAPRVYLWDASNPTSPQRTLNFNLVNWLGDVPNDTASAAAATIVKLYSGRYLIIVKSKQTGNSHRVVRLFEGRSLTDVSTWSQVTVLSEGAIDAWDHDEFNYQHISSVTDCSTGRIYVIATKGDTFLDCDSNDSEVARLYELGLSNSEYSLTVRNHRYFTCSDGVAFGSAAGVYVSRDGRMNFYSSERTYHTVDTGVKVKFREFYSGSQ